MVALALAVAPEPVHADAPARRPAPNLDGRAGPKTEPWHDGLWLPRIVTFPLLFVSESALRKPLGALVTYAELNDWPRVLIDFFTFDDRQAGIVPVAYIDFGFRPSGGFYFFWDDFLAEGHDVRVRVASGGSDWLKLDIADRLRVLGRRGVLMVDLEGSRRPDHVFHALGAKSDSAESGRYRQDRLSGLLTLKYRYWRRSTLRAEAGVAYSRFDADGCCGRSLEDAVERGALRLPSGFEEGYFAHHYGFGITVDTREDSVEIASGVAVGAQASYYADLQRPESLQWLRYGASAAGYVDLTGTRRVLGLVARTELALPLQEEPVPFTELAELGGFEPLPGFRPRRLLGESAVALTLEYRWPVWIWVDGFLEAGVGNVFGQHWEGLTLDRLRASFAFGLRPRNREDLDSFYFLIGFGTEPFAEGGDVRSFRFILGNFGVL